MANRVAKARMRMSIPGSDMRPGRNRQSGLTLVELIVVLAILAVLTTLVSPALTSLMPGYHLRAAADDMIAQARRARSMAFSTNKPAGFFIDVSERQTFAEDKAPSTWPQDISVNVTSAKYLQRGSSISEIRFYPDGTSTGGLLELLSDGMAVTIRVDWFDGQISLSRSSSEMTDR